MAATGFEFVWDEFPAPASLARGSLLTEAQPIPSGVSVVGGTDRFRAGVKFVPWGCDALGGLMDSDCAPATTLGEADYAALSDEGTVTQYAFLVWDALKCSMLSWPDSEIERRLAGRFALRLSEAVAGELVTAAASSGHGFAADATVLVGGVGLDVVEAVGTLEAHLASVLGAGRGLIHVPPIALAYLSAAGLLRSDGDWIATPRGHGIVVDAGYGGDITPDGEETTPGTAWLYASGAVYTRIAGPDRVGALNQESMLLTRNIRKELEEAYGLLVYDPCAVAAVKVEVAGGVIEGS